MEINELFDTVATSEGFKAEKKPFKKAMEFAIEMRDLFSRSTGIPVSDIHFAGSLRRQKEMVGDLDIVWVADTGFPQYQVFTTDLYKQGYRINIRQMGECFLSVQINDFLIEFKRADRNNLGAFLLFATGSGDFNVGMRTYALSKGYHLSQYGLATRKDGKKSKEDYSNGQTEKGIFEMLGIPYVEPQDRKEFIFPEEQPNFNLVFVHIPKYIWDATPPEVLRELQEYQQPEVDENGVAVPRDLLWNKKSRHLYYRSRGALRIKDSWKLDRYQESH